MDKDTQELIDHLNKYKGKLFNQNRDTNNAIKKLKEENLKLKNEIESIASWAHSCEQEIYNLNEENSMLKNNLKEIRKYFDEFRKKVES